jgi:hypothetical protein
MFAKTALLCIFFLVKNARICDPVLSGTVTPYSVHTTELFGRKTNSGQRSAPAVKILTCYLRLSRYFEFDERIFFFIRYTYIHPLVCCVLKLKIVHAFLDRDGDSKTKMQNTFYLFSAFVFRISNFCVKKLQKVSSKNQKF